MIRYTFELARVPYYLVLCKLLGWQLTSTVVAWRVWQSGHVQRIRTSGATTSVNFDCVGLVQIQAAQR
jgi:hypothetical protein